MDQTINTSFIPKKTIQPEIHAQKQPVNVLIFLGTIIFFIALAALLGVYFWKVSIQGSIDKLDAQIKANQAKVNMDQVAQIQKLDNRLNAAGTLIGNHQLITPIFQALQTLTLKTIQYTRFSFEINEQTKQMLVSMSGRSAGGYTPIALQADLFKRESALHDPFFSNLSLDDRGRVNFDLTMVVDPDFLSYKKSIEAVGIPADTAVIIDPATGAVVDPNASLPASSTN